MDPVAFSPLEIESNPDIRPEVRPDLIVDEARENEVILLHPEEARWALSNRSGLALTGLLDGSRSVGDIARSMERSFGGVSYSQGLKDLRAFLGQLYECNLLANCPLASEAKAAKLAPTRPPGLTIYPTEECNLRCKHCAVVEGSALRPTLEADQIRALIEEHTARYPNPTVSFMGGEPLLRPEAIEFLEFACRHTNRVYLGTNGLLIDDALAARLGALPVLVQVSLDGADPETHDLIRGKGTFQKTLVAVERLCRLGEPSRISLAVSLTRCGAAQVREMIELATSLGLGSIRFLPLNRVRAARTHWDRISPEPGALMGIVRYLLFEAREAAGRNGLRVDASFPGYVPHADPSGSSWCPLGKTAIVDSQGNIFNCPVHNTKEYIVGRAGETTLAEAMGGEANRALRERMVSRRWTIAECRVCPWRNFCQGGCQAFTASRTDSIWVNDEFCEFRRELYREYVRRQSS